MDVWVTACIKYDIVQRRVETNPSVSTRSDPDKSDLDFKISEVMHWIACIDYLPDLGTLVSIF